LDGLDVGGVAVDGNILTASIDSYVQQRLKIFDVLVVNTNSVSKPRGGNSIFFKLS